MLEWVDHGTVQRYIRDTGSSLLVAHIYFGSGYAQQMDLLRKVWIQCGAELKICIVQEEALENVQTDFAIHGSPFFLLFVRGREVGRILGKANWDKLMNLLRASCCQGHCE